MKTFRKNKARTSLLQKGFREEKGSHNYFYLYINDKKTGIRTYFSRGGGNEIEPLVLGEMKKQLRFDQRKDFENFLSCPFSGTDYLNMLKEGQKI